MPKPARTVSFVKGDHAIPTRGAKPHCRCFMSESPPPFAISSPEPLIVSLPAL
jgi:hypothetical protein